MEIELAKTAGFCFGVERAVSMVYELLEKGKKVYTLGPIIHNPQLVKELEEKGVTIIESPKEAKEKGVIVIRSHGVTAEVEDEILQSEMEMADATCPFVKKIHKIVREASEEGRIVLIAGDKNHPEVVGICGHYKENKDGTKNCFVFSGEEELNHLIINNPHWSEKEITVASQTTFSVKEWKKCLKIIKKVYTNVFCFDTICSATALRQKEAQEISERVDLMIVVGGHHSSNTAKLKALCSKNCETYLVETADELPLEALQKAATVGVTAGASTPAVIIKEVLETMSNDAIKNTVEVAADSDFAAMLEESLKSFNTDEKVHGVVVSVTPTEVYVDVGRKQAGFIPADELSNDPSAKPEDLVKVGDEMDLLIMRTNDQEGTIMLSKKRLDAIRGWEDIAAAAESKEVLSGVVTEVVKGGVIVTTKGVRVFVPASQATASRNDSLEDLLKQEVNLRIIEVNRQRGRRAVGSIRSVLRDERKAVVSKFWEEIEEGKEFTGTVKSLTQYGAFVDLGGVDGMIHISELSWTRIKHPSEVVNVGDEIDVFVKDLDKEKKRISLGYKTPESDPWTIFTNNYNLDDVVKVKIVSMMPFGAFAEVIPGADGLIHISQIVDRKITKPADVLEIGQEVDAKIIGIDLENHKISLSMRALLETAEAPAEEATEETAE